MRIFLFKWQDKESLALQLGRGVERLSINTAVHDTPTAITLWHDNKKDLRIRSQMHDITERLEVGVLEFTKIQSEDREDSNIDIPISFKTHIKVKKLVISERDVIAESGIILENAEGEQIIIVAGAMPHTLAVRVPAYGNIFQPEYPLEHYQCVVMT